MAASYSSLAKLGRIKLPSGTTYALVDVDGRAMIAANYATNTGYAVNDYVIYQDALYYITTEISAANNTGWSAVQKTACTVGTELKYLKQNIVNPMHFLGTTTTPISDGSTDDPITIGDQSVHPQPGDVVLYDGKEFVWGPAQWNEFGSTGSLHAMAFADTASGTVTYDKATGGSVSVPQASQTTKYVKIAKKTAGSVATNGTSDAIATVSAPTSTFLTSLPSTNTTGTAVTSVTTSTADVLKSIPTNSKTGILNGQPSLTYKRLSTASSYAFSAAPTSVTFNAVDSTGTLPSWSASVSDDLLTIAWSAGALTTTTSKTCVNGTTTSITYGTGLLESYTGNTDSTKDVATGLTAGSTTTISEVGTVSASNKQSVVTAIDASSTGHTATFLQALGTPGTSTAVTSVTAATTVGVPTSYTVTDPTFELQTSSSPTGTYAAENPLIVVGSISNSSVSKSVTITNTATSVSVTVTPDPVS